MPKTIRFIAVKVYNKKRHQNYSYEYDILKSISHPNILNTIGASEDNNHFYMEMEYCISEDLSNHLFPEKNFTYLEKVIKTIATELLLGLKELHSNGIIHCNLKPSNILIDEHGNVKICDFKKALFVDKMTSADIRRNKRGLSPCYTAPEIFSEEGKYSFKSDLWALGCIMYEMASGQVPFRDDILNKLINKILRDEPNYNVRQFTAYSVDFQNVVKRLLNKDPNHRASWGEIEKMPFWDFGNDSNTNNNSIASNTNANINAEDAKVNEPYSSKTHSHGVSQTKSSGNLPSNSSFGKGGYSISTVPASYNKSLSNNQSTITLNAQHIALEHNDEEDEYSEGNNDKGKGVNNTDQEFNFQRGAEQNQSLYSNQTNDSNYSKSKINIDNNKNTANVDNMSNKKLNFLELSVLNVSKVITRDRRVTQTTINDMAMSLAKNTDIPNIQSIMIHTSDRAIKPIIGNKVIEPNPPITEYNGSLIPFSEYKIDRIKDLINNEQSEELEKYLLSVYQLMDQYVSKGNYDFLLNILNYFETIVLSKEIANNIINTCFVKLFINFMDINNDNIRIRACSIIAYLIRYATSVQYPLDKFGLTEKLSTFIKDSNVTLNKKAIATLGEYLFFVATQAEGESTGEINLLDNNNGTLRQWNISNESILALLYALNHSEEVVQFYALKTIENTVTLTTIAKTYFAMNDSFVSKISDIYFNERCDNFEIKTSALSTISHIIKLEPNLMKAFIEKFKTESLRNYLSKETSKNQQCIINIILFGIVGNVNNIKLIDFDDLMLTLVNLLETANSVVRGKIILLLSLVFSDKYLISKFGEKVLNLMLKLRKDKHHYYCYVKIFESFMINYCNNISKHLIPMISKSIVSKTANTNSEIISLLVAIAVISPYYKISFSLFKSDFIEALVSLTTATTNETIHTNTLDILRCFSETAYSVEENSSILISSLFAKILDLTNTLSVDFKRIPLNICANILTVLLDDDKLYSSVSLDDGKTNQINSLILNILPLITNLLKHEDTVNDSLSFLSLIIERNSAFIAFYRSIGIIDYVFQLMIDDNFISNLNLLKILSKLIESKDTKFEDIIELKLLDKVNYLISKDSAEEISIYTEYVIEMLFDLMYKLNETKKKKYGSNWDGEDYKKNFLSKIENVAMNFKLCIKLLGCDNGNIQEKSCVIVIFILQFLPTNYYENKEWEVKFTGDDVLDLLKGLGSSCVKIHKKIIRIFKWIIEFQSDAQDVLGPFKSYIQIYIEKIRDTSKDPDVVDVASKFLMTNLKIISSNIVSFK